jgi:aryl-alcohol dehydrogenase-like predicted oxidoreductase
MEFRQFGRTDLKVSAIGFGCWEIGGTYGRIDASQFQRAVGQAIDGGITCFDTAEAYGMGASEEALARALAGRRNQVVIATKFGVGYEEMPNRRDSSRQRVLASIDKSLERLRTDHVDIYLVHWPDPSTPLDETMAALDDIVRQGKARYIGVSNFRLAQIEEAMRHRRIDVVQYAWNMFDRRMQAEIFPYCAAQQIGVMAYGSLAYGMLSGAFRAGNAVRRERLAVEGRHARQPKPVPNPVRPRAFSAQPGRGRGAATSGGKIRQEPAAIRAVLDLEQPGRRHRAGRFSHPGRVDREFGCTRLGNQQRRHGPDRRHSGQPRGGYHAAGLARRLICSCHCEERSDEAISMG